VSVPKRVLVVDGYNVIKVLRNLDVSFEVKLPPSAVTSKVRAGAEDRI
jgi:hypothetical protein